MRRSAHFVKSFGLVSILLIVLWAGILFDLERARKDILVKTHNDLTNLALAFSMQIESSVKTIDVALVDLRDGWRNDKNHFAKAVRQRQDYLKKELAFQVAIIDANGMLVFSSLEQSVKPVDLSDREHFQVHRQRSIDELFISKPVLGRVSKRWSIQFTRPLYDKEGQFSGVIVLSVSPEYFSRFYRSIQFPEDSSIGVVRQEGEILSRHPNPESALGKSLTEAPFLSPLPPDFGVYERMSQVDGVNRMFAWRKVEGHNLIVLVGHAMAEMLRPYHEQRSRAFLAASGISVLLLLIGYMNHRSIKQRMAQERRLTDNEERWRLALGAAGDGVWDWNLVNNTILFSLGGETMLDHENAELSTNIDEWKKRIHPNDLQEAIDSLEKHFRGETAFYVQEHRIASKDGSWQWILNRGMVIARAPDGKPLRMVGTHTDISARKQMEVMLTTLATTDALTGLNNRRSFLEKLEREISRVKRYPETCSSVLMMDIDFFKKINDTHGHAAGDAVLKHVANILQQLIRECDTVGRLGGEEFGVLLPETNLGNAEQSAQRLCAELRKAPVIVGEHRISVTMSIGVAMIFVTDPNPDDVLHRADVALYEAKHLGRDRVVVNHQGVPFSDSVEDFVI